MKERTKLAGRDAGAPRSSPVVYQHNRPSQSLAATIPLPSKETGRTFTGVEAPDPHLGWYSRGYLPHWDQPGMIQAINFRLADSLPRSVLEAWQNELALSARSQAHRAIELRRRVEDYLDAGRGECWLRRTEIAQLVESALLHFDATRYRLLAWCIMPNHVHSLIETKDGFTLPDVVHSWKSYTAGQANKLLGRRGDFWEREYLDRFVRDARHFQAVIAYIEENPVKAGLSKFKTQWLWSSARIRGTPGNAGILAGEFSNNSRSGS